MQRAEANNYYPHLMASKLAIDGSTAAATDLDFIAGATLATHTPVFAIITYGSGTLGVCDIDIKADTVIMDTALLTTLTATESKIKKSLSKTDDAFTNDPALFMNVTVGNPSAGASTFNVYIYGIELN